MSNLIPLSSWRQHPPDHHITVNLGKPVDRRVLEERVTRWIAALVRHEGTRWAVYHEDSFEFLCILLALWQLRRTACIPSDNRPGTVDRLAGTMDGLVGEFDSGESVISTPAATGQPQADWITPDPDFVALEIYTSGSTGNPKSIQKSIGQLEHEIEAIESLWPSRKDTVVLATVTHQHFYGIIFGLFWPFSSGRPFERLFCRFIEEIRFKADYYQRFALVSSPSHLGRFGSSIDWEAISGRCDHVISSAAPLAREDSLNVGQLLSAPIREIYGSSETGAVAWRIQSKDKSDAHWYGLPGVSFESTPEHTLNVNCPYLGEFTRFELPDRAEFADDGGFRLLGRVDSIVKVEGKRVSLAAIEQHLIRHDWVKNTKALTIERTRVETAIVMQLGPEGHRALQTQGRRAVISDFRESLAKEFEAVVIPRRWRFVEQMPYNRQAKLPLESLRGLFDHEQLRWPEIANRQVADDEAILSCRVPAQLVYFEGHMPGQPILPGIVQVHWAEAYGRALLGVSGRFCRLEVVKFQQVILPDYQVTLTLNYDSGKGKLSFRFESERGTHSSGRICYLQ